MKGNLNELRELLDGMEIGFLTTLGAEGHYHSRPMQLQRHDGDGTLWFATSAESHKCEDLRAHPRCCVAFLKRSRYVSISGSAELIQDRALIRRMWTATWRGWVSQGAGQPGPALLKGSPGHREDGDPPRGAPKCGFT